MSPPLEAVDVRLTRTQNEVARWLCGTPAFTGGIEPMKPVDAVVSETAAGSELTLRYSDHEQTVDVVREELDRYLDLYESDVRAEDVDSVSHAVAARKRAVDNLVERIEDAVEP